MDDYGSSASSDASYHALNPRIPDKQQIDEWRKQWKNLNESIRQAAGAEKVHERAMAKEKEMEVKHIAAKRKYAYLEQKAIGCLDDLDKALASSLGPLLAGVNKKAGALSDARKEVEQALRELKVAAKVYADARNEAADRGGDVKSLNEMRVHQQKVLADAEAAGAFQDPIELCSTAHTAALAADEQRVKYDKEMDIMKDLKFARAHLTKARFLVAEPRERLTLNVDQAMKDRVPIEEVGIRAKLPGERFAEAVDAHSEARKAIIAAATKASHLPVAREQNVQQNLLHAFTSLKNEKGSLEAKHFAKLDKRLIKMMNTVRVSIDVQQKVADKVEKSLKILEEKRDNLNQALAKKRHQLLFSDA